MLSIPGVRAHTRVAPIAGQITAKKALVVLAIFAVVCLGVVDALAVIPHTHGHDLNHSHHETCPVFQLSLCNVHADVFHLNVIITLFLLSYLIEFQKSLFVIFSRSFAYLRAPPVLI